MEGGGDADVMLTTAAGATVATQHAHIEPGTRSFRVAFTPASPVAGDYALRISARSAGGAMPRTEVIRFTLPAAPGAVGAIFIRRGPSSGNKEVATADLRFRRSERIRVEVPAASGPSTARLLDRTRQTARCAAHHGDARRRRRHPLADCGARPRPTCGGGLRDRVGPFDRLRAGGRGCKGGRGRRGRKGRKERTLVAFRVVP